jgi:CheY-like chemotaxis protein
MGADRIRRILVVEDEPIVAITLQDMLENLGHVVVGPAFRLAAAHKLAEAEMLDAAILDVNLGDGDSYGVAALLRSRGIPYVFATGYSRDGLEPGHEEAPVLAKPYQESQVDAALKALLA